MLELLKKFDANKTFDTDDLISLFAFATSMKDVYAKFEVEEPEWFSSNVKAVAREIKTRNAANIERMLREAQSRREALKRPEDKRKDVEDEIERLKSKLAVAV